MPIEDFSYENLNKSLTDNKAKTAVVDKELGYMGGLGGKGRFVEAGFIFLWGLQKLSEEPTPEGKIFAKHELKFHISLPENNREKFAQGWNIIKDILITNHVKFSKIVDIENRMSSTQGQQGKDVTIFVKANPEKSLQDWTDILIAITNSLVKAKIPPGYETEHTGDRADTPIPGSKYISYRYEEGKPEKDLLEGLQINVRQPYKPEHFDITTLQNQENPDAGCCKKCVIL